MRPAGCGKEEHMKRFLCVFLAAVLAVCLCCGAAAASGEASSSGVTQGVNPNTDPVEVQDGATVLAFTGDQHGATDTFAAWIDAVKGIYGDSLAFMSYSGDLCQGNWSEDVYDEFSALIEDEFPGAYTVTPGNGEYHTGAPGETWDELGDGYLRLGEAVATDDYIIYNFGSASEDMVFPQEDIDALAAYLADAPVDIPIFVLGHYPLHLVLADENHTIPGGSGYREVENCEEFVQVLNEHPNVIYLWGHNHILNDPRYGTIRGAGSAFTYDYENPTEKLNINFTYANYGSLCQGDCYGLVAQIVRSDLGVSVYLDFVDDTTNMTNKDSADILIEPDGTVTTAVTDGTGIAVDDILSMSGYPEDPDFAAEY